ncbi:class I SAM-dependent methyltransferase [Leptospira alstonii]|uniref:Ribosomal protein L11 methyltransferase-like protein n=2 Tax=Leptospira alstonii TaxID=28452 RepID=M6CXG3_9LEPT|nr:methyltransferase domain-containing protein [Leptospira alstonii]EMJ96557.1 ribosomal protein L11 methyltransferase-like protein [Leptospira alstonii serovar Sichuan str. 79601]EQA80228.1 ribosomal protein L11 methyltransferase-like protein [Leptospira alstonii serovar Pingchang str. 80-412]
MAKSIKYNNDNISKYFKENRVRWDQFYKSEKEVIEKAWPQGNPKVLDIGCGCAGLGLALKERFDHNNYIGIEINAQAATIAKEIYPGALIIEEDFLLLNHPSIQENSFDIVFSLSCIDWQLNFEILLQKAWSMVKEDGFFIASFRITNSETVNDIKKSYQYINYEGLSEGEIAPYVILNSKELIHHFEKLGAGDIFAYGYYGAPSKTARAPYDQLCFGVLAVKKPKKEITQFKREFLLPDEIRQAMTSLF